MASFYSIACCTLLSGFAASGASAQAVDYATLQDIIGEPVTTSVAGKPQRVSETPASVEIITRDQIARSPAHDVPGLLKTYAGVDVNRWTAGQTDVSVRGGVQTYNPRLLVLVNGRQVYLDHYGMTDWNLLGVQLEEIQQIELVRGPATALFGFNAASAVVNIITIDPLNGRALQAAGEVGTHGYSRLSAVVAVPVGANAGLRVSAGRQRENERTFPADQQQPSDTRPVKRDEVSGTFEITPGAKTRITLDGGYSRNEQLELLPTQTGSYQHFESVNAGVRVDRDTGWGSITTRIYANWLDALYDFSADPAELKNRIMVAQGSTLVRLGLDNVLRMSLEYRKNRIDSDFLFSPRIEYSVWSASGILDVHPSDRLALTFAARLDRLGLSQDGPVRLPSANLAEEFDRHFVRASFNAAALLEIGSQGRLRINGGRGYQVPSLLDLGIRLQIGVRSDLPFLIVGDPALDPVPVWSGEIGYSQPLSATIKFDATFFFMHIGRAIASPGGNDAAIALIDRGGPALVTRFAEDGDVRTLGLELSVDGKIGKHLSWRANYTLTDTKQHLEPIDRLAFSPSDTTARHKANVELGYQQGRWFATTVARYTSSTRQMAVSNAGIFGLGDVKQAVAWDQKVGVRLGNATLYLSGDNLTAARGAAGSSISADRRVRLGLGLSL